MNFRTFSPQSASEALDLLRHHKESMPVAGCTNVLVDIHQGKICPQVLVDLSRIQEWKTIELKNNLLELGSGVTHAELESSPLVTQLCPALSQAAASIGSPQIRNRGTLGGNLQSASPAADCAPPLLAYDATLVLASTRGLREIKMKDFLLGVRKTALQSDELIHKILIKVPSPHRSTFRKSGLRKALAISLVNLAVYLEIDETHRCRNVSITLGSVAPTPLRVPITEAFLEGQFLDGTTIKEASQRVEQEISPISDLRASTAYRKYLAQVMLSEALFSLAENKEADHG